MTKKALTKRRQQILDYIIQATQEKGYPPTVREIGQEVGLTSSSSVHFHLKALEKHGYIERDGSRTRALRPMHGPASLPTPTSRHVPLVGRVAAGEPILATENIEEMLPLPTDMFPGDEVFALRVQGDSMINAGIFDGDLVLVRRQSSADNGDIVVAILDDEATVKRFYKNDDTIELRPENDALDPIITSNVEVVGKVCGLLRSLA